MSRLREPAVVSRSLRNATEPLRAIFIDFDGTLSMDNDFSESLLARCQRECRCSCTATAGDGSLSEFVMGLPAANITEAFGGPSRLARLRAFFATLASSDGMLQVRLLSTSWHPVSAAAWGAYLTEVTSAAGLRWSPIGDDGGEGWIIALADPGPGLSANKGSAIAQRLAAWGLAAHQALLVDDSEGNIASAAGNCDTVWLPQRQGMSNLVLDYIETRALGCSSWVATGPGVCGASEPMIVGAMGILVTIVAVVAAAAFLLGRRRAVADLDARGEQRRSQIESESESAALLGKPPAATTPAVRARKQST